MVDIKPWPIFNKKSPQFVIKKRIYSQTYVIREKHMVMAILPLVQY